MGSTADRTTDVPEAPETLLPGDGEAPATGRNGTDTDRASDEKATPSPLRDGLAAEDAQGRGDDLEPAAGRLDRPPSSQAAADTPTEDISRSGEGSGHSSDATEPAAGLGSEGQADEGPDQLSSHGGITHFHGEFKGQPLDLHTDGIRWTPGDQEQGENVVGEKPDRSPGDTSDLPPTGDQLVDTAGDNAPTVERFRRELHRQSGDVADGLGKYTNLAHGVFSRPPAGSYEVTPARTPYVSETHYGTDVGSIATAAFVVGVLIDRAARWLARHWSQHRKGER